MTTIHAYAYTKGILLLNIHVFIANLHSIRQNIFVTILPGIRGFYVLPKPLPQNIFFSLFSLL